MLAKPFFPVVAMGLKLLRKMSKLGNRGNGVFVGPGRWTLIPPPWAALMVRVGAAAYGCAFFSYLLDGLVYSKVCYSYCTRAMVRDAFALRVTAYG